MSVIQKIKFILKLLIFRRKSEVIEESYIKEFEIFAHTIEAIQSFFLLKLIYTKYQEKKIAAHPLALQSAKYLRNYLISFLNYAKFEDYEHFKTQLKPDIDSLICTTNVFNSAETETCAYCQKPIQDESLTCEENHKMMRCSITKLQLPVINKTTCRHCNRGFLDKTKFHIVTFTSSNTLMLCSFCDSVVA